VIVGEDVAAASITKPEPAAFDGNRVHEKSYFRRFGGECWPRPGMPAGNAHVIDHRPVREHRALAISAGEVVPPRGRLRIG